MSDVKKIHITLYLDAQRELVISGRGGLRSSEDTRETYEEQSADGREFVATERQTSHCSRSRYYANLFEFRIWADATTNNRPRCIARDALLWRSEPKSPI